MRLGVMIANVIWNMMKTLSGMVGAASLKESKLTPFMNILFELPMIQWSEPPCPNAREYPTVTQMIDVMQVIVKHWKKIDRTPAERTSPP